ncbi:sugar phosphate isomerase/epimerase [Sphingobacterium alkalisoli]|uniref:Sugar phosphate isomerase/epimerase n=2 Tax=Sphingobacterium alkalisoli TaxID=1874115 RepID=A0A4U0H7S2_9SPHI|nr:sugar phosphate isomerase/epimerase [Sphingobacterium alkalisoli]
MGRIMRNVIHIVIWLWLIVPFSGTAQPRKTNEIGYALDFQKISLERMQYAKSLGINYIELSGVSAVLGKDLSIKDSAISWTQKIDSLKDILDASGMKVWSIHMPFSKQMDLSILDEDTRQKVIEAHLQVVALFRPLKPQIVLFHPSYYLEKGEREHRVTQLIKSVKELYKGVRDHGAKMVVENMLGPQLTVGERERPLLRTVAECQEIFKHFPKQVGLAVDMCHIALPEKLLLAFGKRVKTLHVSNGNGQAEYHYLPCDSRGENNWVAIFKALDQIGYSGVFMHECKYADEQELVDCYQTLWNQYLNTL